MGEAMKRSGKVLTGAAMILLGACDEAAAPGGQATPGAEMTPGKWRFETEIVEMKSDKLSDRQLERMTNKPPVDERCIGPHETKRLADLFPRQVGDCTIEQDEIRDGLVKGRSQCRTQGSLFETSIDGSYSATTFEALLNSRESGSTRSDGNIQLTMRATGRRIGDC